MKLSSYSSCFLAFGYLCYNQNMNKKSLFLFLPCLVRWKSIGHDADFEMAWVVVCHVEMLGDGQSRCSESDRPEVLRYPVGQASLGFSYVYLPALLAMDGIMQSPVVHENFLFSIQTDLDP